MDSCSSLMQLPDCEWTYLVLPSVSWEFIWFIWLPWDYFYFTFHRQQKSIMSRMFPRPLFSWKGQRNKPLRLLILQPALVSSFIRLDCLLHVGIRGGKEFGADLQKPSKILTWPCWSSSLLVSLTLSKDTTCRIQSSPSAGESGWMYTRPGIGASAFPATTHLELWYAYLKRKEHHSILKTLQILKFLVKYLLGISRSKIPNDLRRFLSIFSNWKISSKLV